MKKLIFSACALTLTCGTAVANNSDWDQLDNDVQALSANLQDMEGGMTIGGRIRAAYESSGDATISGSATDDLGGFAIYNARLFATGTTAAGVGYRLETDFASGAGLLLDAYIDVSAGDNIDLRMGRFRGYVLAESQIDSGNLFFFDRSVNAAVFAGRQDGIAVTGDMDAFNWAITVQNGSDGTTDELFYAVRAGMNFMGDGTSMIEGAYGAGEEMTASAGIAYYDDGATTDGSGFAIEAGAQSSQFSLSANMTSRDDGGVGSNFGTGGVHVATFTIPGYAGAVLEGDNTPWSLMGTFALNESWELGLRYQDLDDTNSTDIIDFGANYYVDGHAMKYIINWTSVGSDLGDGDLIRVGFNTAF